MKALRPEAMNWSLPPLSPGSHLRREEGHCLLPPPPHGVCEAEGAGEGAAEGI